MSHYAIPKHVFWGKDALEEALPYFQECGKKALIVTGKHVGRSPMYQRLLAALDEAKIEHVTFAGITGEPTDQMIQAGAAQYHEEQCHFVIGIGGGSPMDSAKAIAVIAALGGTPADYMGKEISGSIPPIAAIPTTSGTGSEATRFTVITDLETENKMLLKGDCLIPKIAVLNPDFSMDMPKSVTAATGLDAFTHAIEAYTSKKAFAMTDSIAISAVKRILRYLPVAYQNGYDVRAREEMTIAAFEAGICINNSSVTLVHGMSRPIGALFHVPHGLSNGMLLKACIAFALDGAYDRFAALARESGIAGKEETDEAASKKFLEAVEELCRKCELPTLKEYGVNKESFYAAIEKMSEDAIASGSPQNTRKMVNKEDCIRIYQDAYQ